jgi:DNA replication protein DnaC
MQHVGEVVNKIKTETEVTKLPQNCSQYIPLFKTVVNNVCPEFQITENNKTILNALFQYVHNCGVLENQKGIWLYGEIGTGKTTLLKILAEYQRKLGFGFKCVNCATISARYAAYGIEVLNENTFNETNRGCCPIERGFDELGRETIPAKYYGNELNIMQHILQLRYDLKVKTHITTNIYPDMIETLYGAHIYDRAREMFNFIEVKGESFRK